MSFTSRFPRILVAGAIALQVQLFSSLAAVSVAFPTGTDWNNATLEQIRQAVFEAVNTSPEMKDQIIASALESASQTGRFPKADASELLDPGVITFDTIATEIRSAAEAAFSGTPLAPSIDGDGKQVISGDPGDSGDYGGGGGGGVPPPLPGGFGGGGGGTTSTTSDSGGGGQYNN